MKQLPLSNTDYSYVVDDLAAKTCAAIPGWLGSLVRRRLDEVGRILTAEEAAAVETEIADVAGEAGRAFRDFLALDVDEQRSNPLAVLRAACRRPTMLLGDLGVAPVQRGEFEQRVSPDDIYDLAPATWRDVDESLHEPGLMWGAWKAATVISRRNADGPTH